MKEILNIQVLVNIEYKEGQREEVINAALKCVRSTAIRGSLYDIEPVSSKVLYSSPIFEKSENNIHDCKFFDLAQGRNKCTVLGFKIQNCRGICQNFKQK